MTRLRIGPLTGHQVSATDQVFNTLYEAVISAELPPGSKVSESEISKQLDVSRQPVRDAFFRLSNLGFLSIRPQRATLITKISRQAVVDALFTRIALEAECLKTAMIRDHDTLVALLSGSLKQQKQLVDDDLWAFHSLDEGFHETICKVAGHAHVWGLIQGQKAHLDRIRILTLEKKRRKVVIEEHEAFVDAVSSGDAGLAEERLRGHIGGAIKVLTALEVSHPEYFERADTVQDSL